MIRDEQPNELVTKASRSRALWIVVVIAAVVNFAVLVPGFGEQDAARNWNDVVVWAKSGALTGADYRAKVLPLYLIVSRGLYELTGDAAHSIAVLGWLSAAAATLLLVPLYFVWQRLTDASTALAAVIVLNFVPAFWVGHLYAFPHVIAVMFFAVAVACLVRAGDGPGFGRWHVLTVIAAALAGGFKADIVLCSAALLVVPVLTSRARIEGLVTGGLSIAAMVGFPLLLAWMLLGPATPQVGAAAGEWSGRFPIVPQLFLGIDNARLIVRSMGTLFFVLAAMGAVMGMLDPKKRGVVLMIAVWALPAILFWGMRDGNNSRHLMASYVGAAPLIVFALWRVAKAAHIRAAALAVVIVANYVTAKPTYDTVLPSTRLIESRQLLAARVAELEGLGRALAAPGDRKAILASWTQPYLIAPMLDDAASIQVVERTPLDERYVLTRADGATVALVSRYRQATDDLCAVAAGWRAQGYRVFWSGRFETIPDCPLASSPPAR
jgi:Dolichyl-phosphate-mannose-protein mannosyltransferase